MIYEGNNHSTWSCQTGAGNSGLHASADEPTALWRAAGPFCPVGEKDGMSFKELVGATHTIKIGYSALSL